MTSLIEQIRINKTGRIVDPEQAAKAASQSAPEAGSPIDNNDIEINFDKLERNFVAVDELELETVPRDTVLKMLIQRKFEENFTFKIAAGEAKNYIQAMRQVLTRTRRKAEIKKQKLDEFKMYVVKVETFDNHDEVTLVRTRQVPENLQSVYDELIDAFKR